MKRNATLGEYYGEAPKEENTETESSRVEENA